MSDPQRMETLTRKQLSVQLEEIIERFEGAWQAGQRPAIDDFLQGPGKHRQVLLVELVHADLELRLKAGEAVRVESYLQRYPELVSDRSNLMALLAAEYHQRRRGNPQVTLAEYHQRFPQFSEELVTYLQSWEGNAEIRWPAGDAAGTIPFPADGLASAGDQNLPLVAGFQLLEELGRGGMGVVYKAVQVSLNRIVALKMISSGIFAGTEMLRRFRAEAEKQAQLQHPNIVQIYEVGEQDGRPFFSLEYVAGGSLDKKLQGKPQPARPAAELMQTVAQAVHYAHQRGIIHRDLKPANILLHGADHWPLAAVPKIADFGLAKQFLDQTQAQRTPTGAILGTPSYMAPEQAMVQGQPIGPAADVYSLGAILYEMLTGRPPFLAEDPMAILMQVIHADPLPPSRLVPEVSADLATICLKCLNKDPRGRYASAQLLADDLQRFRSGEPILARPLGKWGRTVKWVKRRPAVSALIAVTCLAILGIISILFTSNRAIRDKQSETERALRREKDSRAKLTDANQNIRREQEQTKKALIRETQALRERTAALRAEKQVAYFQLVGLAHAAWSASQVGRAELAVDDCRPELRNWEWYFLKNLCHDHQLTFSQHSNAVWGVAFSPDGKRLASASWDHSCRVWDTATGQEYFNFRDHGGLVFGVAFSNNGQWLATGGADKKIHVYDTKTGKRIQTLTGHTKPVMSVAFSPKSDYLASCSGNLHPTDLKAGEVTVWDTKTWKKVKDLHGHIGVIQRVEFSPDGERLASASIEMTLQVWDWKKGKPAWNNKIGGTWMAYSPDGKYLATTSFSKSVKVFDAKKGKLIREFSVKHTATIRSIIFSPNSVVVATTSADNTVRLYNVETGREVRNLRGHGSTVWGAAFSPDGRRLASASQDQTVKIWDTGAQSGYRTIGQQEGHVTMLAFGADNRMLAARSDQSPVTIWDVDAGKKLREIPASCFAFSPNGRRLATGADNITIWHTENWTKQKSWPGKTAQINALAFSSHGRWIASGGDDRQVRVWDVSGRLRQVFSGHGKPVTTVAFSSDNHWLASGSADGKVMVWNLRKGIRHATFQGHAEKVLHLAFQPGSEILACAGGNINDDRHVVIKPGEIKLWNVASGQEIRTLRGHAGLVSHFAFSKDGSRLASASYDKTVKIWDVKSGWEILGLDHPEGVFSVAFSADGSRLACAMNDFTAALVLWEAPRGWEAFNLPGHAATIASVAYSPTGNLVASGSNDSQVRLWNPQNGQMAHALQGHSSSVMAVAFSPNGDLLASAERKGIVKIWNTRTGKLIRNVTGDLGEIFSLAFHPNGKTIALSGKNTMITLLDIRSAKKIKQVKDHKVGIMRVQFSPDGKWLASCGGDDLVKVWDVQTMKVRYILAGHASLVTQLSFDSHGKRLASVSFDGQVIIWDVEHGRLGARLGKKQDQIWSIALSADGKTLVTGTRNGSIKIWRIVDGKLLRSLRGHGGWVWCLALNRDGNRLVSGGKDMMVKIWDLTK